MIPNTPNWQQAFSDYLVATQGQDGRWLTDQPAYTFFDQTAEIGIWMKEIINELSTR